MDEISQIVSAWDGVPIAVTEWKSGTEWGSGGGDKLAPLLCLPGLVRTGGDFSAFAADFGAGRRVVSLDYVGRGASGRVRDIQRYAGEACLRDVLDVCAALHLHGVIAVGTSFGGLLAMGIAAARPNLLAGAVLNDIGPDIDPSGTAFIRDFVATDPALPDLAACVAYLRDRLPDLSIPDMAGWRLFAALTYAPGPDGRFHPLWDTRIARLLHGATPDLWRLFGALAGIPTLLIHGGRSSVLLGATVARMRESRPDMGVLRLAEVGHAPTLAEPEIAAGLRQFLAQTG